MDSIPESEIRVALATAEASGAKLGSAAYVARALRSLPGVTRCEIHDCKSSPYLKSGEVAIVQLGAMSPACVAGVLREALPGGVVLLGTTMYGDWRWFSPQQWDASRA